MSILSTFIDALRAPDYNAIAAGLTCTPVPGRFGTYRYSGVPDSIRVRQYASELAARQRPSGPTPVPVADQTQDPAPADVRVIDTANRRELETRYPELALPLTPRRPALDRLDQAADVAGTDAGAVLAALDRSHAVDQAGASVLVAVLRQARDQVDALIAAAESGEVAR